MIFAYLMARILFIVVVVFAFTYIIRFALDPKGAVEELHKFFTKD